MHFSILAKSLKSSASRGRFTPDLRDQRELLNDFSLRFPAQTLPSSKIPSTIWYDANGQARALGSEATLLETIDTADAEGWTRLDW